MANHKSWRSLHIFTILLLTAPLHSQIPVAAQPRPEVIIPPFFDSLNNPVPVGFPPGQRLDMTPPAPQLNSFDQAVLKTCGAIGTRVSSNQFKQLISNHPDILQKLQKVSGGELRPGRKKKAQFLEDLTNIWSKRRGFEHIFCGEIYNANDIGGLHFYGRYLQLQNERIGGRLPSNENREEVIPGVMYTLGIALKQGNRIVTDVIKGYSYVSNAEEMLIDATKVFKKQGNTEGACIYNVQDQETRKTFPAVFVRKDKAIVTFYPDATPQGAKCRS